MKEGELRQHFSNSREALEQTKNYLMNYIEELQYWIKYPPKYKIGQKLCMVDDFSEIIILDIQCESCHAYHYDILYLETGRKGVYVEEDKILNSQK